MTVVFCGCTVMLGATGAGSTCDAGLPAVPPEQAAMICTMQRPVANLAQTLLPRARRTRVQQVIALNIINIAGDLPRRRRFLSVLASV